ncbi:hypothetical protein ACJX0J_025213 [Zea mays]
MDNFRSMGKPFGGNRCRKVEDVSIVHHLFTTLVIQSQVNLYSNMLKYAPMSYNMSSWLCAPPHLSLGEKHTMAQLILKHFLEIGYNGANHLLEKLEFIVSWQLNRFSIFFLLSEIAMQHTL